MADGALAGVDRADGCNDVLCSPSCRHHMLAGDPSGDGSAADHLCGMARASAGIALCLSEPWIRFSLGRSDRHYANRVQHRRDSLVSRPRARTLGSRCRAVLRYRGGLRLRVCSISKFCAGIARRAGLLWRRSPAHGRVAARALAKAGRGHRIGSRCGGDIRRAGVRALWLRQADLLLVRIFPAPRNAARSVVLHR